MSEDELDLLNGGASVNSVYESGEMTYYKNVLALNGSTTPTLFKWWIRSPSSSGDQFLVGSDGSVYYNVISFPLGVRAAFQITI